ncbi:MAG: hypothetical protein K2G67_01055 [Muribaculaceae bacterium]|nr:hypothetical protein [Muribaculaceae bacterium]
MNGISVCRENRNVIIIKAAIYILVAAYAIAFSLMTEWNGDALAYSFFIPAAGGDECHIPMRNLKDILISQINHYYIWNGRFIVHFIVQLFCGILGKILFSLCNAVMWVLLIREMAKLISKGRISVKSLAISTLMCILIFGGLTFTPPFAINYVWVAYVDLLWLRYFFTWRRRHAGRIFLLAILSLIAGQLHEGFSIPICGGVLIWLISKKFKISKTQWLMGILYGIGAIILIAAPGNFSRLNETEAGGTSMVHIAQQSYNCFIFPIVYLIIRAFTYPSFRTDKSSHPKGKNETLPSIFLKSIIVISLCFCLVIGNLGRGLIVYNLGFAFLCLQYMNRHRFYNDLYIILTVFSLATIGWNIFSTYMQNTKTRAIISEYEKSASGQVYLSDSLFIYNLLETCGRRNTYTNLVRSRQNPDKPFLRIYPESAKGIDIEKDTNAVIPIGDHSWLCIRSATHPAEFKVKKTLKIGPYTRELSPRKLEFDSSSEIFIDSTVHNSIVIYSNRHPQIRASVVIE